MPPVSHNCSWNMTALCEFVLCGNHAVHTFDSFSLHLYTLVQWSKPSVELRSFDATKVSFVNRRNMELLPAPYSPHNINFNSGIRVVAIVQPICSYLLPLKRSNGLRNGFLRLWFVQFSPIRLLARWIEDKVRSLSVDDKQKQETAAKFRSCINFDTCIQAQWTYDSNAHMRIFRHLILEINDSDSSKCVFVKRQLRAHIQWTLTIFEIVHYYSQSLTSSSKKKISLFSMFTRVCTYFLLRAHSKIS